MVRGHGYDSICNPPVTTRKDTKGGSLVRVRTFNHKKGHKKWRSNQGKATSLGGLNMCSVVLKKPVGIEVFKPSAHEL